MRPGAGRQHHERGDDGLVHVTSLGNDYFHYDAGSQALVGERTGQRYGLGDELDIIVSAVDLEARKIDFRLVDDDRKAGRKGRRR